MGTSLTPHVEGKVCGVWGTSLAPHVEGKVCGALHLPLMWRVRCVGHFTCPSRGG